MTGLPPQKNGRRLLLAAVAAVVRGRDAGVRSELFRDPDRNADPAQAGRLGISTCADRRIRRRRHRRRGCESGNGPPAAQPAAIEVVAARDRRRRHAAAGHRAGAEQDGDASQLPRIRRPRSRAAAAPARASAATRAAAQGRNRPLPQRIKEEKDLEPYERLFANTSYWKRIGEEYQNPLIVTGTVLFMPNTRSGFVSRDVEQYDSFGRRRVVPVRTYMERKGFILRPKFVFIDGRTGATIYSESYREEVLYNAQTNTPALSSYFELMDRLVPNFLSALSSQKIRGTRVLLEVAGWRQALSESPARPSLPCRSRRFRSQSAMYGPAMMS